MKAITVFVLSMAVATSTFAYSHGTKVSAKHATNQAKLADKQKDKAEKARLKMECKDNKSAACKQAKRDFKAEEKAEKRNAKPVNN